MSVITDIKVEIPDHNHMSQVMVYITSESGHTGIGEAWWGIPSIDNPGSTSIPIASVIEHLLAPRLIGKSSRTFEANECFFILYTKKRDIEFHRFAQINLSIFSGLSMANIRIHFRTSLSSIIDFP